MGNQEKLLIRRKKNSLKRYRKSIDCILRLEEKLTTLKYRIQSIKSPTFSDVPKGGKPVTIEDLLDDKDDLEKRLKKLKAKSRRLKIEIEDEIDTLDDPRHVAILEAYFIDCSTIEEIAQYEGYTERHTYKLYSDAISLLTVSSHKIDITENVK